MCIYLKGKRVLLLGDSVMEEVNFDLAILLSGVARYVLNSIFFLNRSSMHDTLVIV